MSYSGVLTVTSNNDAGNGSLREMIQSSESGDTIIFSSSTNNTPIQLNTGELLINHDLIIIGNGSGQTIISGSSLQRIFNAVNCQLVLEDLQLTNGFSSTGGGALVTTGVNLILRNTNIISNNSEIQAGGLLCYSGTTTIINTTFNGNTVQGNYPDYGGGAISNFGSDLSIQQSLFTANEVLSSGLGGAILNDSTALLTITDCIFTGNRAFQAGGAIADVSDATNATTILNSSFENNMTTGTESAAGAILLGNGEMILQNCNLNGNSSSLQGGGLWMGSGNLTINTSVLTNNTTGDAGGGVFNSMGILTIENSSLFDGNTCSNEQSRGGGIFIDLSATLSIDNTSFSNNSALQAGGAIADVSDATSINTIANSSFDNNITTGTESAAGAILLGNGEMILQNCNLNGNSSSLQGGGLWMGMGKLTITNSVLTNNTTGDAGGGVFNSMGILSIENSSLFDGNTCSNEQSRGGGIFIDLSATLSVDNTSFSNNSALQAGGAIADVSDAINTTTILNCNFEFNTTTGSESAAGAILLGNGGIVLQDCNLNGNSSSLQGGAIWMGNGSLTVDNSVFSNNQTGDAGGSIFNNTGNLIIENNTLFNENACLNEQSQGGGIYTNIGSALSIDNASFSKNSALQAGGAIVDVSDGLSISTITNSVFQNNTATGPESAGGAILIANSTLLLGDCALYDNWASVQGGAIWLSHGKLTCNNTIVNSNTCGGEQSGAGGGLYQNGGQTLLLNGTTFKENIALGDQSLGGGIYSQNATELLFLNTNISLNEAAFGGGLSILLDSIEVQWSNITIDKNIATDRFGIGGGILLYGPGKVIISECRITQNNSSYSGAGIFNALDSLFIQSSYLDSNLVDSNNIESHGGAITHDRGHLLIEGSTIAYNMILGGQSGGGGVFVADSTSCNIIRSTISNNKSENAGGGILTTGKMVITASTIAQNEAPIAGGGLFQYISDTSTNNTTTNLRSALFDDNKTNGVGIDLYSSSLPIQSLGYNFIHNDDTDVFQASPSDIEGNPSNILDANLSPLQHNGGFTPTHAIDCSSPAVNAGDPTLNTPDQRGKPLVGEKRDIGSFEYQDSCEMTATKERLHDFQKIQVYPNPNYSGELNIKFAQISESKITIELIQLPSARSIYKTVRTGQTITLDLQSIPSGSYLLLLRSQDHLELKKLLRIK